MDAYHQHILEDHFSQQKLPQVEGSIDDYEHELQDQHNQKCQRHLILLQVRCNATISLLRSKGSETENHYHEIEEIAEEHICVNICTDPRGTIQELTKEGLCGRYMAVNSAN